MGLFSDNHYHTHRVDNSVRFTDTIKVHEHKAPTDESIKLMEEMHDKALKNIIAKVKVEDNLVNGMCYCIHQPICMHEYKFIFKFKINEQEFTIEKEVERFEMMDDYIQIHEIQNELKEYGKSIMLWYALKMFTKVAYEQITNSKPPDYLLK